ncbi:ADP-ribosylhydrolase ARH1-like [Mercenaria mercenaria]|uniref:ADP-ribosylhydrolase ARH1-like n=1 Tax=Mercenaria mercenaria TaxID=6596 RepID=UPI00234F875B|nr:ADP-ribosylhydrolase ARH1-like [Mercenaria mercenaria]
MMSVLSRIKRVITGVTLQERYEAAMVLSGVGDALGYKNGIWEFCHYGEEIHEELEDLGGLNKIKVSLPDWKVSDDTVMHMATAEALIEWFDLTNTDGVSSEPQEQLYLKFAAKYKECLHDMKGRAPGATCVGSCGLLKPDESGGYIIPFNKKGGGCGAAMRAMCIGLFYPHPEDLENLITVSVESGRMTHHHPTGYLGALTTALFTSYSIQGRPLKEWGAGLMETLPKALEYIKESKIDVEQNVEAWDYFTRQWTKYLQLRGISDGKSSPKFPKNFGVKERDAFYSSIGYMRGGFGGKSGHDAPMIAYDSLLGYNGSWPDLCNRAMFHAGDSDSTGVIAACCYGAMFGYKGVNKNNYINLEYRERLRGLGEKLYRVSHPDKFKKQQTKAEDNTGSLPKPSTSKSSDE